MSAYLKSLKIGVVGGGVVGRATARAYLEYVSEVRVYDVLKERRTHDLDKVLDCDIIFVCLPTPQIKGERGCDVSAIEDFFCPYREGGEGTPNHWARRRNFVLRSTVPVGTTRRLVYDYDIRYLVHSPEFLTARCAEVDAQVPSRNVVGTTYSTPDPDKVPLVRLYKERFPEVPIHVIYSDASESVKLFQNAFFATKVAFWNEVRSFCVKKRIDWMSVRAAILADGRIHPSHTEVPGPDGLFGFGGSCLPKDLANATQCLADAGIGSEVMSAALYRNLRDREGKGQQ